MSDPHKPITYRPEQLIAEGEELAREAYEAKQHGIVNGPAIPSFPKLSKELCGSFCVGLHAILGAPGAGKSVFAAHLAEESGVPSLIVCLEMPPLEYLMRSAARRGDEYISHFRDGTLHPDNWRKKIERAALDLPLLQYLDGTIEDVSLRDIEESFVHLCGEHKYGLIVIDSVHAWAGSMDGNIPENDRISQALRQLRKLAEKLKVAIIAVGEQNRISRNSDGQVTGAGSRLWEHAPWTQLVLSKDSEAADTYGNRDITLSLAKNRRGKEGFKIPLRFEGGFMRFTENEKTYADCQSVEFTLNPYARKNGKNGSTSGNHTGRAG